MNRHTPGPWYLDEISADDWQVNSDLRDYCLFQITPTIGVQSLTDEDKANAHLIAAAPELLAALAGVIEWLELMGTHEENSRLVTARAAIKKATGSKE